MQAGALSGYIVYLYGVVHVNIFAGLAYYGGVGAYADSSAHKGRYCPVHKSRINGAGAPDTDCTKPHGYGLCIFLV